MGIYWSGQAGESLLLIYSSLQENLLANALSKQFSIGWKGNIFASKCMHLKIFDMHTLTEFLLFAVMCVRRACRVYEPVSAGGHKYNLNHTRLSFLNKLFNPQLNIWNYEDSGHLSSSAFAVVPDSVSACWSLNTVTQSNSAVTLLDSCTCLLVQISAFDSWPSAPQLDSCLCLSCLSAPSCSQINVGSPDAIQEKPQIPNRSFCLDNVAAVENKLFSGDTFQIKTKTVLFYTADVNWCQTFTLFKPSDHQ